MTKILDTIEAEYGAVQSIMNGYIGDKLAYENSTAKILAEGIEALYSSIGEMGSDLIGTLNGVVESVDMLNALLWGLCRIAGLLPNYCSEVCNLL